MSDASAIEWTDATWNPVTGCMKIGAGCDHCYAERFSERFRGVSGHAFETGFDLTLRPERLDQPLAWRRARMIFVNSMSDLFHKDVPLEFIARVFDTMERAHWHTFQVLTKRSSLMREFLRARYGSGSAPRHIWCGVSVEDGAKKSRVQHLRDAPAEVRFLSIEPLLGPIGEIDLAGIAWVIVGGESGPVARPMHPDWARSLRDQCATAGVPFFFKQWGAFSSVETTREQFLLPKPQQEGELVIEPGGKFTGHPIGERFSVMRRVSKKVAGRLLDGREWSEFPPSRASRP